MIITALERQKRQRRLRVYVDDAFALTVALSLAQEKGLHDGMAMSAADLRALRREDERHTAYEAALRLLSYRPRSEKEMRFRLGRRGVAPEVVEETVRRLRRAHYLDDEAFAQFWTERRDSVSPRSRALIQRELRFKGIDTDTASSTVEGLDDEEAAYRAAVKRLPALTGLSQDVFRRRLGGFLTRRGFSYDTIRHTLERCWSEADGGGSGPSEDSSHPS
jgi:regulatory protein